MLYLQSAEKDGLFLRCCKQAFTSFVFRLVSLIISDRHIRSCRDIQCHNGLVGTISDTVQSCLPRMVLLVTLALALSGKHTQNALPPFY
jgi:hypothetical protein